MGFLHSSKPLPKSSDIALLEKSGSLAALCTGMKGLEVYREQAHSFNAWKTLVLFPAATEGAEQSWVCVTATRVRAGRWQTVMCVSSLVNSGTLDNLCELWQLISADGHMPLKPTYLFSEVFSFPYSLAKEINFWYIQFQIVKGWVIADINYSRELEGIGFYVSMQKILPDITYWRILSQNKTSNQKTLKPFHRHLCYIHI